MQDAPHHRDSAPEQVAQSQTSGYPDSWSVAVTTDMFDNVRESDFQMLGFVCRVFGEDADIADV
jgi:hypothetical protein